MNAISVENVSKKFILAHDRPKNLAELSRGILRRRVKEDFWALSDVSFDVKQGEALGIIGHNGAGKSTMLKLLTRIMNPTKGRIRTRGRVSALIEVGAGFHPEMTGRENIYLNGSILGMTQREIASKFDEIVSFAELEKFIDTPVKRYSSGMYARLGFAVAAHVDPEVLIVDEVLSVGDAAFQERCTKRMRELRASEKTIVFVSHNMGAVTSLCDRVITLWKGEIYSDTDPERAIKDYRRLIAQNKTMHIKTNGAGIEDEEVPLIVKDIQSITPDNWEVEAGKPLRLRVFLKSAGEVVSPRIALRLTDSSGTILARTGTADLGLSKDVNGECSVDVVIPQFPLLPGKYYVQALAADAYGMNVYDKGRSGHELLVLPPENSKIDLSPGTYTGLIWMNADWIWQ